MQSVDQMAYIGSQDYAGNGIKDKHKLHHFYYNYIICNLSIVYVR